MADKSPFAFPGRLSNTQWPWISSTSGYKLLWAHCNGSICDNYDEL